MNMQTKPPHTAAEKSILDSFAEMIGQLPGDGPVTAARDRLLSLISDSGLPTRRIESWHYTDLRNLMRDVPKAGAGSASQVDPLVRNSIVLPVIQGRSSDLSGLEGIQLEPFMDLLASGSAVKALVERGSDDLIGQLNGAFVGDGYSFSVAADQVVEEIIEVQSVQSGGQVHSGFADIFMRRAGKNDSRISRTLGVFLHNSAQFLLHMSSQSFADINLFSAYLVTHMLSFTHFIGPDRSLSGVASRTDCGIWPGAVGG